MLQIIRSQSLEPLAQVFLGLLDRRPPADPAELLAPERVVVGSLGTGRWLLQRMAQTRGIGVSLAVDYAAQALWNIAVECVPGTDADPPFAPGALVWRLLDEAERLAAEARAAGEGGASAPGAAAPPAGAGMRGTAPDGARAIAGASVADLAPLLAYLDAADPLARLQFAERLARVFDGYLSIRPEWLGEWAAGREVPAAGQPATQAWQAALWRRIVARLGFEGHVHPLDRLIAELDQRGTDCALPPRLHLFALPAMAPIYWRAFMALARHTDVIVYAQTPSPHYLADLVSEKRRARLQRDEPDAADAHDIGHGLLAAFGAQAIDAARDLDRLLDPSTAEAAKRPPPPVSEPIDFFDEPPPEGSSLLAQIQRSVFDLDDAVRLTLAAPASSSAARPARRADAAREPPAAGQPAAPDPLPDRSLSFHRCHGLVRELEALHDALLARFAADRTLKPGDILVWLPELDVAAPAIHAVFGTQPRERRIAYAVSGLAQPGDGGLGQASLALLDFASSRLGVDAALDLLRLPPVARRFGLDDSALALLPDWLAGAGVRWALDAADRASHEAPADPRHTWAWGLERLLLGIAFGERGAGDGVFAGTLPHAGLDDSAFDALGGLLDWARVVAELRAGIARPRPVRDWADWLGAIFMQALAAPDDVPDAMARLQQALGRVARNAAAGGHEAPVEFALMRDRLACELDASAPGAVPQGQITFTTYGALRHHPYRVIAILGLDDAAIPRSPQRVEFDLLAPDPKGNERARRIDDRAAFLAALLGAREAVHLSWRGFDAQTGEELPPAIVVAELLDWIGRHDGTADATAGAAGRASSGADAAAVQTIARPLPLRERLVIDHPLHAFSPRLFGAPPPAGEGAARTPPQRSFRTELVAAAANVTRPASARALGPLAVRPFLPAPLPAPADSGADLDAGFLRDFLAHPARFFLRRRLGLATAWHEAAPEPEEPFALDRFGAAGLADDFARRLLAGADAASLRGRAEADARIPSGVPGALFGERIVEQAQALERRALPLLAASEPPRNVLVRLGAERVVARLPYIHALGAWNLVERGGSARMRAELWVAHLLACAHAGRQVGPTIHLCADGEALMVELPDGNWRAPLERLVADARLGLTAPPWCPARTAWGLLGRWKERGEPPPRAAAEAQFWAGDRAHERDDGAWRLIFGGTPDHIPDAADFAASVATPWTEDFPTLALRLYGAAFDAVVINQKVIGARLKAWEEELQ